MARGRGDIVEDLGPDLEREARVVVFGQRVEQVGEALQLLGRHRLGHQSLDLLGHAEVGGAASEVLAHRRVGLLVSCTDGTTVSHTA